MLDTQTILTIIFCLVDDLVKQHPKRPSPGAHPRLSDSELIALVFYKELAGIESERQLLRMIRRDYMSLFPELVDQSQFNRRARELAFLIEDVRQDLLRELGAQMVEFAVIDSTAVPMKHPVRAAKWMCQVGGIIGFGRRFAHRETYYGTKLHLVINRYGVPMACAVTSPTVGDCMLTRQLLENRSNLLVLGDKAYYSYEMMLELFSKQSILLVAGTKKSYRQQNTEAEKYALQKGRLLIESVINMLKNHLMLNRILAKTEYGLLVRIHRKITAFILGVYLNLGLGRPALAIKSLAA